MMKLTIAGLTAIIASVSAIQTQADASAEWGYGGYSNPWAQQSTGGWYGGATSSPFGYGDSKVVRLQRDVSYLVKQNSALKTRLVAAEAAITALQTVHEDPDHTAALAVRVTALETKAAANMMAITENDTDIAGLDVRVSDNEGDITVLDMMVCDNMTSLAANAGKIATNMMSIGTNSTAIAAAAATAVDSAALASMVSTINASIAANTAGIGTNATGVATNSAGVGAAASGIVALS
jgi:hypothetical protein